MSIPKIVGLEQEYAIASPSGREINIVQMAYAVVNSFTRFSRILWDYSDETPFLDARGFSCNMEEIRISNDDNIRINNLLQNGARFYVDHAHPEFSTPECAGLRDLIACDKAGEFILMFAREQLNKSLHQSERIHIFKNNSDHKGNSYGCHENYLIDARAFERLFPQSSIFPEYTLRYFIPFLVTRQIYCGAGKVGSENGSNYVNYQVSQRADFFSSIFGAGTTANRPLVNTRDEPHADRKRFRRLHLILGDANMSEYSTFLKIGTTRLVLKMIEDDFIHTDLSFDNPVKANIDISHDISLKKKIKLADGRKFSPLEIQRKYLEEAQHYCSETANCHEEDLEVLKEWELILIKMSEEPRQLIREIDWVIKLWLIERYKGRKGLSWRDPRLKKIDIFYHCLSKERGLYYALEQENKVSRILDKRAMIEEFINQPPKDSRAYFRARCLNKFSQQIVEANWDSISFKTNANKIKRLLLPDPLKGTYNLVNDIIEKSSSVEELLNNLKEN
jgi:proteasome accessory factor PafA2